jgi:hypothetical protein
VRHDETIPREDKPDVPVAPLRIPEPTDDMVSNPEA